MAQEKPKTNPPNPHVVSRPSFIVGIGASAGGLEALESFVRNLSTDTGMAFVIVQHLPAEHPSLLGHLISLYTSLPVFDAADGLPLQSNHIYVVQPGSVSTILDGIFHIEPSNERHPKQIDHLFQSLAENTSARAVGIILSGSGTDGTAGLQAIKAHGGFTVAQSPETSKYPAMPTSAIHAGVVDIVLPVEKMSHHLLDIAAGRFAMVEPSKTQIRPDVVSDELIFDSLARICDILRWTTGRNFAQYKRGTITRRVRHRLRKLQLSSLNHYMETLETDPREPQLLSRELLVRVTQFFRDAEVFDYLEQFILPRILASTAHRDAVRIWVPGCASGEEAYSLAILVHERLAAMDPVPRVQIFATDIDPEAIAEARLGRYPEAITNDVSPARLTRYFTREKSNYVVAKELREMCIFSEHSLIRDPPFIGVDLISCRNVLIYLDADLQNKLVPLFHYAIRHDGFLVLGPSEGLSGHTDLFQATDKRFRIFQRSEAVSRPIIAWPTTPHIQPRVLKTAPRESSMNNPLENTINAAFERMLFQDYVPPSAVVDAQGNVICIAGLTGPYFQPPAGLLTTNLLDITHDSLRIELRTALHAAASTGAKITRDNLVIDLDGIRRCVRLTVRPLPRFEDKGLFAVVLQEKPGAAAPKDSADEFVVRESIIGQLESELRSTRASLRSSIEELESANEELKSANEELLSTNEEMQSSNEELQSSQEELKSVNEELATVNAELARRIEELGRANADLQTLFMSTDVATLFLDREHCVTKFTPAAKSLFRLIEADIGRPLSDLAPRLHDCDLASDVDRVIATSQTIEKQVETIERHAWYLLRVLPYRTLDHEIIGAVVTLIDITKSKHLEAERERLVSELQIAQDQLRADLEATTRLFKISSLFLRGGNLALVLDDILDAAIAVTGADFGNIQLLDRSTGDLRIFAHRGLSRDWIDYWNHKGKGQGACGTALATSSRIIVEDIEASPHFADARAVEVQLKAGIRAVQSTPLTGRAGNLVGMISTHYKVRRRPSDRALQQLDLIARQAADILERAHAEELIRISERRFRVFLDATMDASFRMNADWTELRHANGRGFIDDVSTPIPDWLDRYIPKHAQAQFMNAVQEAIHTKSVFLLEHEILRADGSIGWASSSGAPLLDDEGEIIEWFGLARDTTERKEAELVLKEANVRLREADQRKNAFLAMLSHELRNPLAAIVTSLYLIEHAAPGSDGFARAREVIRRQTNHLVRMVDDLLDTTRLTLGKIRLQKERLDLNEVVQRVVEDHRGVFQNQNINLELTSNSTPSWVLGDQTRLSQVFGNLLQNAVKFTPTGGKTSVFVERIQDRFVVRVTDSGAGLSGDMIPRLFEPFTQAESTLDRNRGGLGLGLAVVKGLVELHDGIVSVTSQGLNQGTSFTISLPSDVPESLVAHGLTLRNQPKQQRIVIIEDNYDAAEGLRELLVLHGHDVSVAFDGISGVELVRQIQPSVILCDLGLPGMNGFEVVRTLRSDETSKSALFIALSGYGSPADVDKAKQAGFDVHLVKPLHLEALERILSPTRTSSN